MTGKRAKDERMVVHWRGEAWEAMLPGSVGEQLMATVRVNGKMIAAPNPGWEGFAAKFRPKPIERG